MEIILLFILYILFLSLLDSYLYGVCKENFIEKNGYNIGIFSSLIWYKIYLFFKKPIDYLMVELPYPHKKFLIDIDIRYRYLLQKPLEIGLMILLYLLTENYWLIIAILISHYWLIYDRLYCVFLNQENLLHTMKGDPTWLMYVFQSGFWLFRPYSFFKYNLSAIIGFILAIILLLVSK